MDYNQDTILLTGYEARRFPAAGLRPRGKPAFYFWEEGHMLKVMKQYLRATDLVYLGMCMFCSMLSILVLISIGRYLLGGFDTDEIEGIITGLGGYRYAVVQAGAMVMGLVCAIFLSCIDYRALVRIWPVHTILTLGMVLPTLVLHSRLTDGQRYDEWRRIRLGQARVIMLPADDATEPRRDADDPVAGGGAETDGRRTILVVDDEPDLREVVRRMLGKSGYEVIIAADGPEALEKARAHPGRIDLLISDIMMPEMSGTELAAQLHEFREGVPVLFMSGYAAPMLAEKGTLNPETVLLQKPFRKAELISAVENVLSQEHVRWEELVDDPPDLRRG